MADIKEMISSFVTDEKTRNEFLKNPTKAIEAKFGIDLPDEQINAVIDGVKQKAVSGGLNGIIDSVKDKIGIK
ncbi:MAG: hypothetical protein IJS61_03120 [Firmicutes bacterium]|nr:hypothetical protein [Bacillota bacterium]